MDIGGKMAIFNSLTFDGQNSLDNGVYITAESSYDAPERDIEEIEIAGRNGAFLLDKGRWKNIEVTYKAGAFGSNQSEFAAKIRDFRNLMASRIGYKRLTDTYNPNEFRLGTFKDAFGVKPESANRHGEFDLIFNCKPQRYLTSGETEITVSSGQTITNPTAYASSPLLTARGYGVIQFNGYEIEIINGIIGDVSIAGGDFNDRKNVSISSIPKLTGDTIDINNLSYQVVRSFSSTVSTATVASWSGDTSTAPIVTIEPNIRKNITIGFTFDDPVTFTYGTAASKTITANVTVNGTTQAYTASISYDGAETISFKQARQGTKNYLTTHIHYADIVVHSTKPTYGDPTYIDCDLGEAYEIDNGRIVSLNRVLELGSKLPVFAPGENEIAFDNTITELVITPRWWIL